MVTEHTQTVMDAGLLKVGQLMVNPPVMHQEEPLLALLLLVPLAGSAFSYLISKGDTTRHYWSGWIASLTSLLSFLIACFLFLQKPYLSHQLVYNYTCWNWITVGNLQLPIALSFDALAGVMTLVVTGVGTLIHFYAIGYMQEDPHRPRFFAYLNLFLFSMLTLVLGDNLALMFVGWEGVGLCSYLLIGFWFKEMPNALAGQKAFVVNRIGDAGFLLGIFTLLYYTRSVSFADLAHSVQSIPSPIIEIAALLLFVGAIGKSAQFPLFVWLPDAMAGPTPVSALIHAATMVTAGVYMVTRLSFLYIQAPYALMVITCIGAFTAFLAATIALVQNDIKKVLAYSTVSQLGFMFMALGATAFASGIFHVVTHAFFKACLFMSAGSVIIGCHHEQDMRRFGGLRKTMPWTAFSYIAASLAIAGFPFTSGFFSKDAILWTVFSHPELKFVSIAGVSVAHCLWFLGAVTAFLTAFYITRSVVLTFFGTYRGHHHPHESPLVVTVPIVILAILSLLFGAFYGESLIQFLGAWSRPDILMGHHVLQQNHDYHRLEVISMVIAVMGIVLASVLYLRGLRLLSLLPKAVPAVFDFLRNKWFVDEFYAVVILKPLRFLAFVCYQVLDRFIIDGLVNGSGLIIAAGADAVGRGHLGRIGVYALVTICSSVLLLVIMLT